MSFYSTNKQTPVVNLKEAVVKGLADDNGLFMPTHIPQLPASFFENTQKLTLPEIALEVSTALLKDEMSREDLRTIVEDSLNFDIPVVPVHDNIYSLELFHGPTSAFKDVGARFMARLLAHFTQDSQKQITVLVATSGDTGSAVANGFLGVPGINVVILYPSGKVSNIQEKQLTTLGQNITALEIEGTFDDCQYLVKKAFLDKDLNQKMQLTSANSINIARLIPQSFYYHYAYAQVKDKGREVVFATPSGNYGNITGGLLAKRMGLPVHKFIAATNANDIVPEYLHTGFFIPRPSEHTISNAMDVGNPSNFARLMDMYDNSLEKIREEIIGYSFTDAETRQLMQEVYQQYDYVLDPHGAIGYGALKKYFEEQDRITNNEQQIGIFLETAHPAKFIDVVEDTINQKIEIPFNLQGYLEKKKESIRMSADYEALKDYLISQA
ncbi:threonine synthase [Adhaeribacter rhizoryzae]|uniref:Threonine synthase n=1 Tax=Adhaeribacter rhizoryzae TaxID=2607907 RepID=A0A5M6DNL4_9BACT|nr:threonine synthase [Adhaeribacter rhizoryzae]KAA5549074.1 threonine synthase [Adhaeribacter rhizoryzae]